MGEIKYFAVYDEKDGCMTVIATDKEDAIEKYYQAIESCIGHTLKICGCFGPKQPLDRTKVTRPIKVVKLNKDFEEFRNENVRLQEEKKLLLLK